MLASGAGLVVEHEPSALAGALRSLLTNDSLYRHAVEMAAVTSAEIAWESGAQRYAELVRSLIPVRAINQN
jgi:hypothetical protein